MKRFILIFVGVILLGILAGCDMLGQPIAEATPTLEVVDFAATETPAGMLDLGLQAVVTPTAETGMMRLLYLEMPETLQTGTVVDVPLILVSDSDISLLTVEIAFPVSYLYLEDCDPNTVGIQVLPGTLPPSAVVEVNDVSAMGVLRYRVSGLGTSEDYQFHVLTVRLQAVSPSETLIPVDFVQATILEPNGNFSQIPTSPVLVQIVQGVAVVTPELTPTPTPLPPATETPLPTLIVEAAPTPEPVAMPTPIPPALVASFEGGIPAGVYYRIQPGENLFRLSLRFGSTADEIARVNQIADVRFIPARTFLRIPVAPPVGQAAYLVSSGDTFYSISRYFGFTVNQLAAQNGIANPSYIQVGQWIVLRP
ncbi:MAG: LysM peptidoglycan-binding domain-containing protein [Anaerolineae bacterium]|nr:LysM peptidoglycan-binding domain-containing protein [Anaerolineae bacterium]